MSGCWIRSRRPSKLIGLLSLGLGLFALLAVASCSDEAPNASPAGGETRDTESSAPQERAPTDPPRSFQGFDVVLVLVDTLRADRLGLYGYQKPTSPFLDELGEECVVFEECSSAAPWTLPSVSSLMTSRLSFDHGAVNSGDRVPESMPLLAESFAAAGYRTASFSTNPYASALSGLDRGFEQVRSKLQNEHSVDLDEVQSWIREEPERPHFLYLHSTEPHRPYRAPQDLVDRFGAVTDKEVRKVHRLLRDFRAATRVQTEPAAPTEAEPPPIAETTAELARMRQTLDVLYDAGVAWADRNIEQLVAMLQAEGRWERTVFVVLADHGEEFSEHGTWLHDQSLYQELLHVPLLWRIPGGPGARVQTPCSLLDVAPTLLDLLGLPVPTPHFAGHSLREPILAPGVAGDPTEARVISNRVGHDRDYSALAPARGPVNVAVRSGDYKGILDLERDAFELFDLRADPRELRDLHAELPAIVARLREATEGWLGQREPECLQRTGGAREVELSEEDRRRLRELGYIDR